MSESQWLTMGRISGVHGIKGWLKVFSHTAPPEAIIKYSPWRLNREGQTTKTELNGIEVEAVDAKFSGKALVVALANINDRNAALELVGSEILVRQDALAQLDSDEYYWFQLEGLRVIAEQNGQASDLGKVDRLLETGANDVLIVKADEHSIDDRERLIPYIKDQTIKHIDLNQGEMRVEWDPEF